MSNDQKDNNQAITPAAFDQAVIAPVEFAPATGQAQSKKIQLKPLNIALGILLLIGAIVVWFLFTAKSVVVKTIPATDSLVIEGGLKFEIDQQYVMLQGQYRLKATYPGYYPLDVTIEVDEEQNQVKTYEFQKLPGSITIQTPNQVSASVWIDNQKVGQSGVKLDNISAGTHQLKVQAPRYFAYTDTIEVTGMEQHQDIKVALKPAWGDVNITTEPVGADIYSNIEGDGQSLGKTPFDETLLEGKHLLTIKLQGYKDIEQPLEIKAAETIELAPIYLERLDGILQLNTSPKGVSVTLNGKYQGLTPLTLYLEANQDHQLSLFKDGYQQHNQSLSVPSGKEQSLKVAMQAQLGQVTINASEPDALLYVDGRLMGRANQSVTLTVKQHDVVIKKEGYVDYQVSVLPRADLEQVVDARMKTIEQARWENIPQEIDTHVGAKLKLFKPKKVFTMGASRREQGRRANEVTRRIRLERPFYIGKYEITNAQFRRFAREHSSGHVKGNSLNNNHHPVVNVSWKQAALFCNWLSEKEQLLPFYKIENDEIVGIDLNSNGFRLPTEAEWTWTARFIDGQMLKYAWGKNLPPSENSGNFADRTGAPILGFIQAKYDDKHIVTAPVGSFKANQKGIFDLSGNAAEWMHDYYEVKTGLSRKIEHDPLGAQTGDYHVIRGSSWAHGTMSELRLSFRDYGSEPRNDVGFRIARFVDSPNKSDSKVQTATQSSQQTGSASNQGVK